MSAPHVTTSTWVWSDTHFGHHNIVKFQSRPATHEIIMLSNWAQLVRDEDTILHLGDLHLRSNWTRWAPILRRMPGRKLLILGNHDKHGVDQYKDAGFQVVDPFVRRLAGRKVAFTHRPLSEHYGGAPEPRFLDGGEWLPHEEWDVNVHGHIHLNEHRPVDGTPLEGKAYLNMSVEAIEFRPWQLGAIL